MTIYEPQEVNRWSTKELDRLIGKYVFVEIDGDASDGRVAEAGVGRGGVRYVAFSDGSYVDWNEYGQEVRVSVHAEAAEVSPL